MKRLFSLAVVCFAMFTFQSSTFAETKYAIFNVKCKDIFWYEYEDNGLTGKWKDEKGSGKAFWILEYDSDTYEIANQVWYVYGQNNRVKFADADTINHSSYIAEVDSNSGILIYFDPTDGLVYKGKLDSNGSITGFSGYQAYIELPTPPSKSIEVGASQIKCKLNRKMTSTAENAQYFEEAVDVVEEYLVDKGYLSGG